MSDGLIAIGDVEWGTRIADAYAAGDAAALRQISRALQGYSESWAGRRRIEALHKAGQLLRRVRVDVAGSTVALPRNGWWQDYGLPQPDGRPLWQYRITEPTLGAIETRLRQRAPHGLSSRSDAALFVLWAAERFRRQWDGRWQRWQAVAEPLGLPWQDQSDTARLRALTDIGLAEWQLTAFRSGNGRARAETLIRQGGFPVAAVDADAGGAVWSWLERLVAHGASQTVIDVAALTRLGQMHLATLPQRWQSDFFAELGAELAAAVLALRRRAEGQAPPGMPISVWLDQAQPDWRETLPLAIGGEAGRRLVDGLLRVAPQRLRGAATAVRLFECIDGNWRAVVRLGLDGVLPDPDRLIDAGWSRGRLRACGLAAQWLPGDLAVAEAVDGQWDLMPVRADTAVPLPLNVAVSCQLVVGGNPMGGTIALLPPLKANVIVCAGPDGTEAHDEAIPDTLRVVGSGSGRYQPAVLWLLLHPGWTADTGKAAGPGPEGRDWWRISAECRVTAPDGDVYLVRPGQTHDARDIIEVISNSFGGLTAAGDLPLWPVRPPVFVRDGGGRRTPPADGLWWRTPGQPWRSWTLPLPGGRIDVAWRQDGVVRAAASGVVLPDDAGAEARDGIVRLRGFADARVDDAVPMGEGCWRLNAEARRRSRAGITWRGVALSVRVPQRESIVDWQGRPAPLGSKLYLGELDRWVARCNGPMQLLAHVEDRTGRKLVGSGAVWSFSEDLPLAAIASDIAALLRPEGLGCRVALNFNNGIDELWYVHQYRERLEPHGEYLITKGAIPVSDVVLAGRPLHQPQREEAIANCSLEDCLNQRPIRLPRFEGSWIVYLKHDGQVLSEPQRVGPAMAHPPAGLAAAMAVADREARVGALEAFALEAEVEPSGAMALQLVELAAGLNGLAPGTFDILLVLARRPLLAARVAFVAPESRQGAVLALAEGLPFLWGLIGRASWERAANLHGEALFQGLRTVFPVDEALRHAAIEVARIRRQLVRAEPSLAHALNLDNDPRPLAELANTFMVRAHDRIVPGGRLLRDAFSALLPQWPFDEHFWEALDAPCAAALHAVGHIELDAAQLRVVRQIAHRHPVWFAQGLVACSRTL